MTSRRWVMGGLIAALILLGIYTAHLRGRLMREGKRIETAAHKALALQEQIENTRAAIERKTSVARLAERIAHMEENARSEQVAGL